LVLDQYNAKSKNLSFEKIFYYVGLTITLRVVLEWLVFEFPIQMNVFQDYVRFYLENVYYFFIVFLIASVFISKIAKNALLSVMNFGVRIFPIILIPPIIDGIILGRREGYYYATADNFFGNFFSLSFLIGDATLGISIEILIGLIGIGVYTYSKTRHLGKAIVTFLCLDLFLVLISTPDLFFGRFGGDYIYDHFLPLYYFLPFFLFLMGGLFLYQKNKLLAILKNARLVRSFSFACAVMLGGISRSFHTQDIHWLNLSLGICVTFFVWQVSVIINDIYDLPIDRVSNQSRPLVQRSLTVDEYRFLATMLSFFALSCAVVINVQVFIITIVALIFAHIYSRPPFRLRKDLFGNVLIGLSLFLSYLIGIYAASDGNTLTVDLGILALIIFIFGTVISMAKDIKDIEADKKQNIKNLFTMYGKEKGKWVTLVFIFIILNIPTVIFLNIFIFLLSILACYVYHRFESIRGLYLVSMIIVVLTCFFLYQTPSDSNTMHTAVISTSAEGKYTHNYNLFVDRNNQIQGKILENNGWLFLEALLRETQNPDTESVLRKNLIGFGNQQGLYGMWPEQYMTNGKDYFSGQSPVMISHDIDDTAWAHKLFHQKITDDIVRSFLSDGPLSGPFEKVCFHIHCRRERILRVWNNPQWHDEIDIVSTANFISSLDDSSRFMTDVFRENQKMINYIVENVDYRDFYMYFQPKITGEALLYFYDAQYHSFLSKKAREIITNTVKTNYQKLQKTSIISKWGGGKEFIYGYNIWFVNEKIPGLILDFLIRNLNL